MTPPWQPFREPLLTTILRNSIIALLGGAILARVSGDLSRWPLTTLVMLWPTFGGHFVELFFLNILRPRLPASRAIQIAARLAVWFFGGTLLAIAISLTAGALHGFPPGRWSPWKLASFGGPAFIVIELIAHLAMQLRRLPTFYNGRG